MTFALRGEGEAAFRSAYEHFYYRVKHLEENMLAYWFMRNPHGIVSSSVPREGAPAFAEATFDGAAAEKYTRKVERIISKCGYIKATERMPKPDIPVTLTVDFGFACERFRYRFSGEEELVAFCKAVCDRSEVLYRFRYSESFRPSEEVRDLYAELMRKEECV